MDCPNYFETVVSVGSIDSLDNLTYYSNYNNYNKELFYHMVEMIKQLLIKELNSS